LDKATREAILVDLGSAESELPNAEWKPATVLSGSVIEAIPLLDAEQKTQAQIEGAIKALKEKGKTKANPPRTILLITAGH
jgi:hypothetical protein